jgi:hypothetical protein
MLNFDDLENSFFRNLDRQSRIETTPAIKQAEKPATSQELTSLAKWLQENSNKDYTHLTIISRKNEADFLREKAIKDGKNLDLVERQIKMLNLENDKRIFNRYRFDELKKGENLVEYWNRWANNMLSLDFSVAIFYRHLEIISEFKNND